VVISESPSLETAQDHTFQGNERPNVLSVEIFGGMQCASERLATSFGENDRCTVVEVWEAFSIFGMALDMSGYYIEEL